MDTARCDMCQATDTSVVYHTQDVDTNWFPILACNSWMVQFKVAIGPDNQPTCDGINHTLVPFGSDYSATVESCYWWYQGRYKDGWIYWQGDWRCRVCAEKTLFGPRA